MEAEITFQQHRRSAAINGEGPASPSPPPAHRRAGSSVMRLVARTGAGCGDAGGGNTGGGSHQGERARWSLTREGGWAAGFQGTRTRRRKVAHGGLKGLALRRLPTAARRDRQTGGRAARAGVGPGSGAVGARQDPSGDWSRHGRGRLGRYRFWRFSFLSRTLSGSFPLFHLFRSVCDLCVNVSNFAP